MTFCACIFFYDSLLTHHSSFVAIIKKSLTSPAIETQSCQNTRKGTHATNRQTHKEISYIILKIHYIFLQKQSREQKCKH